MDGIDFVFEFATGEVQRMSSEVGQERKDALEGLLEIKNKKNILQEEYAMRRVQLMIEYEETLKGLLKERDDLISGRGNSGNQ